MLANLEALIHFNLRKDRLRILLWLISIIFITLIVPPALDEMFPNQAERDVMAETMANPAMTAMMGPGDTDHYTIGAMTSHNMLLLTAVVVGLMSILLMSRHTRGEEEDGLTELILSLPVGRLANLNAGLIIIIGTNCLLALGSGFGLYVLGLESMDLEGSLLYGAVLGAVGIFFAGVTAIFAQMSESSRGATGLSIAALLAAYLLRAVGDVSNETLSLLSPLGLVTRTEAYATNNWWPVFVLLGASVLLFLLANYLNAIRDWGSGFLQARAGKERASQFLQNPLGLALRIQRTAFISWAIGMFILGMSYGSVMGDLESFFEGNEMLAELLVVEEGYTLTEQFLPMLMLVMALLSSIPPVMAMNKLSSEERKGRIEDLLATTVSRQMLMGSYLLLAIVIGFIMLSLTAIGLWVAAEAVMEDGFAFGIIYGAAFVYFPALLLLIGLAVLLIGWVPRFTGLIWIYFVFTFFVNYLGDLLELPTWLEKASPFSYLPALPVEEMEWAPVIILSLVAIVLMVLGLIGYRRRDITGSF